MQFKMFKSFSISLSIYVFCQTYFEIQDRSYIKCGLSGFHHRLTTVKFSVRQFRKKYQRRNWNVLGMSTR